MANEKVKNISDNDLAKYQGMLDEIEKAYTTTRDGWQQANSELKSKTAAFKGYLLNLHEKAKKHDANDIALLPELEKRAKKFDEEIKAAKGKDAELLQARKANVIRKITEVKSTLKK